jgi:hypothetical protein
LCKFLPKIAYTKYNFYFGVSTLKEASVVVNSKPRVRVQSNSCSTRAFVLDVDVRPGKPNHYATKEEALIGVNNVAKAFNLPDPIIVDSGFGLHVYWPMAAGIPSDKWMEAAGRFKRVIPLIEPRVVADGSRVADSAGVLRIPASFNLKNGELTPVSIIQWSDDVVDFGEFYAKLTALTGASIEEPAGLSGVKPTEAMQSAPVDISLVARNCNWVKEYLTHSETAGEPEWYAMLGLVPHLFHTSSDGTEVSGVALAHALSSKHPDYSGEETYAKYQQVREAQNGPTTCERFRGIDPARCEGCPFAATVKSPIHTSTLARERTDIEVRDIEVKDEEGNVEIERVSIPIPPTPYFRGENGGVYMHKKQKDAVSGEWTEVIEKVYEYDMYPTRRFRTESLENEGMEIHLWLPKDGLRKFRLPNELLADNKSLNRFMNTKGVVPDYGKSASVSKYMVDYVIYLQKHKAAEVEYSHFGWREINTATPKFVVSDGYYDCEGNLQPGSVADHLKTKSGDDEKALPPITCVETKGTLEDWKKGFAVYEKMPDSDPYILAALTGFAAALFGFTEYNGMLYNMMGDRGAGKSTALKVMSSVFGIPAESRLRTDDTVISSFNTIGYLNSVAVAFDEITNMEPKNISDFVLAFTGGRGKTRANQDGQNKVNETTWGTVVVCTSNTSVLDKYTANRKGYGAEGSRTFEVNVIPADAKWKAHVDACISLLRNNYGHAGREFVKYLLPRAAAIRNALARTIVALDKKAGFRPYERFCCAYLACVLVAGKISRDILHLHNYDAEALVMRILNIELPKVREQIAASASDPVSCLGEFFNANLSSLLRMNNGLVDLGAMNGNMHSIKARLDYVNGSPTFAHVSISAVRDYCRTHNIDPSWMRQGLLKDGIIVRDNQQFRLTTGTQLPAVNCRCWKIDMNNPKLAHLVIEDTDEPNAAAG